MAKLHYRVNLWTCGLCGKSFYREPYLDLHMAKSHYDQTSNVSDFSFYFFYILNTIKFPHTYEKKIYSILHIIKVTSFRYVIEVLENVLKTESDLTQINKPMWYNLIMLV